MEGSAHLFRIYKKDTIEATDVLDYVDIDYAKKNYIMAGNKYNYEKYPNAIDPTVFYDADGKNVDGLRFMVGWDFLLEIDEKTGLVIHPKKMKKRCGSVFWKTSAWRRTQIDRGTLHSL